MKRIADYRQRPGQPKIWVDQQAQVGGNKTRVEKTINELCTILAADDTWFDQVLIQAGIKTVIWAVRNINGVIRRMYAEISGLQPGRLSTIVHRMRTELDQVVALAAGAVSSETPQGK